MLPLIDGLFSFTTLGCSCNKHIKSMPWIWVFWCFLHATLAVSRVLLCLYRCSTPSKQYIFVLCWRKINIIVVGIIEVTIISSVFEKLLCWFHFGTKSTRDIGPRSTFALFLSYPLLQCLTAQTECLNFAMTLRRTSVQEPVYHWAVRYLLDLFTSLTWTVECVMGEEMKPGETPIGVSGVNPGGTVASGLLPYSKYSSVSSWQIKCHLFSCCIIFIRNHFEI